MKRIVVLGGGYGGVLTAKRLAINLKRHRDIRITLIDKKPYHTLLTELHEVAANRIDESSIKIDLHKIFAGFPNVDIVMDKISNIDFDNQTLHSGNTTYSYNYLVIGTGSKPTFWGIPGAEKYALSLWSYEDAVKLKEHTLHMFREAVKQRNPEKRKSMLSFVVVGAGFTGIEMVGEIAEFTQELCRDFHVDPAEVQLHVVDALDKILPILPDSLIRKAEKRLHKLGVNITLNAKITEVKPDAVCMGTEKILSNTIVWTAGIEGSELVGNLDLEQKGRKRIMTNEYLQTLEHDNVYVVGDNIFYIPEGASTPVPQMVENAEHAAPLIANNITADIVQKPKKAYKPTFHGTMVCIGSRYGVAHIGTPKKMVKLSGFPAMLLKHLVNMMYLFQVCGMNKVYSYMLNEFFHVRNNRSFVGGHLAKRSPNFWLVPLRVFVGGMWLIEGYTKAVDIFKDPTDIFLIPAKAVDGIAAASEVWEEGGTVIAGLWVPDFMSNIVDWSMNLMFYKADGGFTGLAYLFQGSMVLAEILFGLLLIIGLFTAVSAIATFAMGVMIWISGMASNEMLWYMVASIALVGGSGSTLGLDYYVLPWLKNKVWAKIPFVKRWYIYTD